MNDSKLKDESRELLAAEYEKVDPYTAKLIREGAQLHWPALRAIVCALNQRDSEKWLREQTEDMCRHLQDMAGL
jgi:hypothetical protein